MHARPTRPGGDELAALLIAAKAHDFEEWSWRRIAVQFQQRFRISRCKLRLSSETNIWTIILDGRLPQVGGLPLCKLTSLPLCTTQSGLSLPRRAGNSRPHLGACPVVFLSSFQRWQWELPINSDSQVGKSQAYVKSHVRLVVTAGLHTPHDINSKITWFAARLPTRGLRLRLRLGWCEVEKVR